jgi:hypothetical protein
MSRRVPKEDGIRDELEQDIAESGAVGGVNGS